MGNGSGIALASKVDFPDRHAMTKEQSNILWVGLFLVVAYVFTDIRVRNLVFGREQVAHPAETTSFTLYNVGSPSSTGNGQSNTGNSPTINGVASPTVGGTATPVPGNNSSGGTVLLLCRCG